MRVESFSDLVRNLYMGALEDSQWTQALNAIATELNSVVGYMGLINPATRSESQSYTNFDPDTHRDLSRKWQEHYGPRSPIRTKLLQQQPGQILPCHALIEPKVFERSVFFNEWWRPLGLRYQLHAIADRSRQEIAILSVVRPRSLGPYGSDETALMKLLLPHYRAVYQLKSRLVGLARWEQANLLYSNTAGAGVVHIGRDGRILAMNGDAERLLRLQDGLSAARGRLTATRQDDDERLNWLLQTACQLSHGVANDAAGITPGGMVCVSRPSGRRPFTIRVLPIVGRSAFVEGDQLAAIVEVIDPEAATPTLPEKWLAPFNLTPAETRLANALLQGGSHKEIALRLGISPNTVAVQRRSLYRKLGVSRHHELLQMARVI